jgi:hypothetical protein
MTVKPARPLCLCLFMVLLTISSASAQGVPPYPNAITDRLFYPKTPMAPPAVNTPFADPDLGAAMVRVTDQNLNPRIPGSFFRNPPADVNEWSVDNSKFYVAGSHTTDFAFAFHPDTMTVSALPGAGAGGGLVLPLRPGPTFRSGPDVWDGDEGAADDCDLPVLNSEDAGAL